MSCHNKGDNIVRCEVPTELVLPRTFIMIINNLRDLSFNDTKDPNFYGLIAKHQNPKFTSL